MNIIEEKKEIIKWWINSLDNPVIIQKIKNIKELDAESFDFEKEWENGMTVKEARRKSLDFIKSLPWKNSCFSTKHHGVSRSSDCDTL